MTNPTVPEKFTNVIEEPVVIKKYSNIGAGCIILPGVTIAEGCALCAMTLATKDTKPWNLSGIPVHPHQGAKPEDAGTGYIGTGSRLGFHQFQ